MKVVNMAHALFFFILFKLNESLAICFWPVHFAIKMFRNNMRVNK